MSLYNQLFSTLRSTGFVTSGQADELADSVGGLIHSREKALYAHIAALQSRLDGFKTMIITANEGTNAMDAAEYSSRAVATFDALSAPGLLDPIELPNLEPAIKPVEVPIRVVIDCVDGVNFTGYSEKPVDILLVRRTSDVENAEGKPMEGALGKVNSSIDDQDMFVSPYFDRFAEFMKTRE